jgi:hypothetical protein
VPTIFSKICEGTCSADTWFGVVGWVVSLIVRTAGKRVRAQLLPPAQAKCPLRQAIPSRLQSGKILRPCTCTRSSQGNLDNCGLSTVLDRRAGSEFPLDEAGPDQGGMGRVLPNSDHPSKTTTFKGHPTHPSPNLQCHHGCRPTPPKPMRTNYGSAHLWMDLRPQPKHAAP